MDMVVGKPSSLKKQTVFMNLAIVDTGHGSYTIRSFGLVIK
jgi:hypothetical protein